jgi:hypothetical protein
MTRFIAALACLAMLAGAGSAARAEATKAPQTAPTPQDQPQAHQSLSSRLAETQGTLRPPPVDEGMQKTPTQKGTMPVIPPPGTTGGAPEAVPK